MNSDFNHNQFSSTNNDNNNTIIELNDHNLIPLNDHLLQAPPFPTGAQPAPIPPNPSLYSSSGLDVINLIYKVINRPNPKLQLGPIDLSCSFVIASATLPDNPILYCSPSFELLTGYSSSEILGKNCRFLQSPEGYVTRGSRRKYCDDKKVFKLKTIVQKSGEGQVEVLNYKKNRQPFRNLITIISIGEGGQWESTSDKVLFGDKEEKVLFYFGFQVDIVEQPNAILQTMKDGSYCVNYTMLTVPNYLFSGVSEMMSNVSPNTPTVNVHPHLSNSKQAMDLYQNLSGGSESTGNNGKNSEKWIEKLLLTSSSLIQVITSKGVFVYTSNKCKEWLNYDSTDIVGYSLNDFIHPTDLIPVMREVKECELDPICLSFRMKHKDRGYIWMESVGKAFWDPPLPLVSKLGTSSNDDSSSSKTAVNPPPNNSNGGSNGSKPTKYIVLSGRILPTFHLPRKALKSLGTTLSETDFWLKLSLDGVILFGDDNSKKTLKILDPLDFIGKSVYNFLPNNQIPKVAEAFKTVFFKSEPLKIRNEFIPDSQVLGSQNNNSLGEFISIIYPGTTMDSEKHPSFLLLQSRLLNNNTQPPIPNWIFNLVDENEDLFKEFGINSKNHWEYSFHQLKKENQWLQSQIDNYKK